MITHYSNIKYNNETTFKILKEKKIQRKTPLLTLYYTTSLPALQPLINFVK